MEAKDIWTAVRKLTGGSHNEADCAGIDAESLNQHYSTISTDSRYSPPVRKQSADTAESSFTNAKCSIYLITSVIQQLDWMDFQLGFSDWEHQSSLNQ